MSTPTLSHFPLVPRPWRIDALEGRTKLSPEISIVVAPELAPALEIVADRLRQGTGWKWELITGRPPVPEDRFVCQRDPSIMEREAYSLSVSAGRIRIGTGDAAGAFYAGQTLLQLLPSAIFNEAPVPGAVWELPDVTIEDRPRFHWRGVMLDSVRHFQPIEYIRKFVDLLAQHRINVLHWHLTDDQGWRLEIRKYPRLTEVGGRRRETIKGHLHSNAGGDGVPVEGFYTQAEVRELIEYAARRNVAILPEIEMPGHAKAAVAAYPHLGCLDTPVEVCTQWGVHETLFNIRPETLSFLQDVLEEVVALFPFEFVHIGGDEAVKTQWRGDADTQARMKALGVPDESHLQGWFIGQMAEFLQSRGKRLIGWDEILEGGLPSNASVMSWRGKTGAIEAAAKGHEAVMCTQEYYYFDYAQSRDPLEEPLSIGGCNTLRGVYESQPIPPELTEAQAGHIIGIQGQLWTEYIASPSRLEYMAFPRVCALAEVAWSPAEGRDYANFRQRLARHLKRLDAQDVRYRALTGD